MRTALLRVVGVLVLLLLAACFPVDRTVDQITVEAGGSLSSGGHSYGYQFFRNEAYQCGREGDFTFLVLEPADAPGSEAPLWVYLHGGGTGYYDEEGIYHGGEANNDEETFEDLVGHVQKATFYGNGNPKDSTLRRRLEDGYRVLVPSMCDHDLYAGMGKDYPNNPNGLGSDGGEVNGLQANLAALDHTVANRATSLVFEQGTSAGSVGAWALSQALHREGIDLTGAILDSYFIGPRAYELFAAGVTPQQNSDPDFDSAQVVDKIGFFTTDSFVEDQIAAGFDQVPLFALSSDADPTCGGTSPAIAAAVTAGYSNNCDYWQGGIEEAIATQDGSPHASYVLPGGPHTPSNNGIAAVNDQIEPWLTGIWASEPAPPFGG